MLWQQRRPPCTQPRLLRLHHASCAPAQSLRNQLGALRYQRYPHCAAGGLRSQGRCVCGWQASDCCYCCSCCHCRPLRLVRCSRPGCYYSLHIGHFHRQRRCRYRCVCCTHRWRLILETCRSLCQLLGLLVEGCSRAWTIPPLCMPGVSAPLPLETAAARGGVPAQHVPAVPEGSGQAHRGGA